MAQGEEYEIWILENRKWGLKAWSRAFDVGWALARVHSVPVWCARIPVHEIANVVAQLVTLPFLLILQRSLSTRKRP